MPCYTGLCYNRTTLYIDNLWCGAYRVPIRSHHHPYTADTTAHGRNKLAWIYNHMHGKVWDEITYPFPNSAVKVVEWMSKFMVLMDVMTYPCRCWCYSMLVKRPHASICSRAYTPPPPPPPPPTHTHTHTHPTPHTPTPHPTPPTPPHPQIKEYRHKTTKLSSLQ